MNIKSLPTNNDPNWGSKLNNYLLSLNRRINNLEVKKATEKGYFYIENIGYASTGVINDNTYYDTNTETVSFYGTVYLGGAYNIYLEIPENEKIEKKIDNFGEDEKVKRVILKIGVNELNEYEPEIVIAPFKVDGEPKKNNNERLAYNEILIGLVDENKNFVNYYYTSSKTAEQHWYEYNNLWRVAEEGFVIHLSSNSVNYVGNITLSNGGIYSRKQKTEAPNPEKGITFEDKGSSDYKYSKHNVMRIIIDAFGIPHCEKSNDVVIFDATAEIQKQQLYNAKFNNVATNEKYGLWCEIYRFSCNEQGSYSIPSENPGIIWVASLDKSIIYRGPASVNENNSFTYCFNQIGFQDEVTASNYLSMDVINNSTVGKFKAVFDGNLPTYKENAKVLFTNVNTSESIKLLNERGGIQIINTEVDLSYDSNSVRLDGQGIVLEGDEIYMRSPSIILETNNLTHSFSENGVNFGSSIYAESASINTSVTAASVSATSVTATSMSADSVTATSINTTSDRRLKNNIKELSFNPLDMIAKTKVYTYTLKDNPTEQLGIMAQDIQEYGSNLSHLLVDDSNKDKLLLKETKLIYVLWEAVKELKKRIEVLEGK